MTRTTASLLVLGLSIPLAACASGRGDGEASDPPCCGADAVSTARAPSTTPVVSPAGAPQTSGTVVRFAAKHEGWTLADMFKHVIETTGQPILYDDTVATSKATVFLCFTPRIKESELFEFLQAVISYRKLVLVPVGPKLTNGKQAWFVMDMARDPCRPPVVAPLRR